MRYDAKCLGCGVDYRAMAKQLYCLKKCRLKHRRLEGKEKRRAYDTKRYAAKKVAQ